jgi:hypothetical protein
MTAVSRPARGGALRAVESELLLFRLGASMIRGILYPPASQFHIMQTLA